MITMSDVSGAIRNWSPKLSGEDYYGLFESVWIRWRDEEVFSPDLSREWILYVTRGDN